MSIFEGSKKSERFSTFINFFQELSKHKEFIKEVVFFNDSINSISTLAIFFLHGDSILKSRILEIIQTKTTQEKYAFYM